MIYIWLIVLTLAVIYLFWTVGNLMEAIKLINTSLENVYKIMDHNAKVINGNVELLNKLVEVVETNKEKEEKPAKKTTTKKKTTKKDAAA